ncbi:hypothetical protein Y032_0580g262 [Ancylostoma ceylanicum]|nr:hypothetical protein Y032_0580g262 [Ancylostoma ceylanicum]
MGYSPSALTEMLQAQQTPIPVAQAVFTRNDQQPPVDVVPNQANANVAVAEQIPAEPNGAAAVPGGGRDVLDIIYKVFRVVLLLSFFIPANVSASSPLSEPGKSKPNVIYSPKRPIIPQVRIRHEGKYERKSNVHTPKGN